MFPWWIFKKKVRIIELKRTCIACPSQWEGRTDDDRPVYIRYRHGHLTVELGHKGWPTDYSDWPPTYLIDTIIDDRVGHDGYMTIDELKKACRKKIIFDCVSDENYHTDQIRDLLEKLIE